MSIFICGCEVPTIAAEHEIKTDSEGFIICPWHSVRRYGWRSRARMHRQACDWMTDLEYERLVVFGEIPEARQANLSLVSNAVDLRDNRDPEAVYAEDHK